MSDGEFIWDREATLVVGDRVQVSNDHETHPLRSQLGTVAAIDESQDIVRVVMDGAGLNGGGENAYPIYRELLIKVTPARG